MKIILSESELKRYIKEAITKMKYHTEEFEMEVENPEYEKDGEDYLYVDVTVYYVIENNGIGSYEFWGSRGYDEGNDYAVIKDVKWDESLYSDVQNEAIVNAVRGESDKWEEELTTKYNDYEPDYYED